MPIYQYKCTECGHELEALQKMSDDKLVDCPACEQPTLKKQVTAAAFKLNGTGWYETDFKNSGKAPAATASSSAKESESASGSESSSDSGASSSSTAGSSESSTAA